MSQQIDNQIVKMQFDNASFEKNVKESMSSIDKLKAALKFDDSSKGLDNLEKQLNKVDMDKLSAACDAVTKKFSFFGTVADQVLRDITTKVAQTAEKMVKSFTIDQVASGWEKYADKTTAVQTIMANTIKDVGEGLKWKDQAEQMAAVTEQIERLNWFTDETSYSLTDMTNNIGKFVAQSVDLEDAAEAMMGISTWAAVSGQNKTQAQMAMYNLSQALGSGSVKAIDWKSIENANMATAEFKETVIETAKALGVLDEKTGTINKAFISATKYSGPAEVSVENFRETLSAGWFNSDVLMQSLEKYGGFANKMNELYNVVNRNGMVATTSSLLKTLDAVGKGSDDAAKQLETLAKNSEMTYDDLKTLFDELNKPEYDLGKRAFAAAQEAKTFQEAMEATSDAVASEWMGIFEAIFGNYLEAKELWTDLANSLWDIFAGPLDNIKWALYEWKDTQVTVFDEADKSWKTMSGRELLLNAVATALNNIGEAIGVVHRALAEVFPIFRVFITEGDDAFDTSEAASGLIEFTKGLKEFADSLKLSEDAANSLHSIVVVLATGIKTAFQVVSGFFQGIFKLVGPLFNIADAIFGLIGKIITALSGNSAITGFAENLNAGANKIKGVYLAVMDRVAWVLNKIADLIRGFPDSDLFRKIGEGVRYMKDQFIAFLEGFVQMPVIQQMIEDFWNVISKIEEKLTPMFDAMQKGFQKVGDTVKSTFTFENLNKALTFLYDKLKAIVNAIKGFIGRIKDFVNGIKSGKSAVESFKDAFGDIIEKIKEFKDNIANFFAEIGGKLEEFGIMGSLETVQQGIHDFVTNLSSDQVVMLTIAGGFLLVAINLLKLSDALTDALTAFSGIGKSIKKVIDSYIKKQKSVVMQVAESIVMVAAALWVLSTVPKDKLDNAIGAMWNVVAVLGVLLVVSTVCAAVLKKMEAGSMVEIAAGVVVMSSSLLVAALALKVLEGINLEGVIPKVVALGVIMLALAGLTVFIRKIDKFSKGALTMIAISGALYIAAMAMTKVAEIPQEKLDASLKSMMYIMVGLGALTLAAGKVGVFSAVGLIAVVFTLNKILPMIENLVNYDYTNIKAGIEKNKEIMIKFAGVIALIAAIGAIAGNRIKGVGIAMLSVAATMAVFVGIAKLVSMMKPSELQQGEEFIFKMAGVIALIQLCSKQAEGVKNAYKGLLKIPVAMLLLLAIVKICSMMSPEDIIKGEMAVLGLTGIIAAMILVAKMSNKSAGAVKAVATVLFAISIILAEVALLSMIPLGSMVPAMTAVLSIMGMLALLAFAISKNNRVFNKEKHAATGFAGVIAAVVMVGILSGVLIALTQVASPGEVATAAGSLVAVLGAAVLIMKTLSKMDTKTDLKSQVVAAVGAVVMAATIGAILVAMTKFVGNVDYKNLLAAAGAIAIVMLALVPALNAMSKFESSAGTKFNYGAVAESVGLAIGALAAVATAIGLLSNLGGDGPSMITSATALAIGMIAICVPIAVLGAVGKLCKDVKPKSAATLTISAIGVLAGVGLAIGLLSRLGNPATMMESTKALSIGLMAICVPIAVIAAVGKFCKNVRFASVATVIGGALLAMAGVAVILYQFANHMDLAAIQRLQELMPALVIGVGSVALLAEAIAVAGKVAGNLKAVAVGFVAILGAIVAFGLLVLAIAGLSELLALFDAEGLKKGLSMFVDICEAIGDAVGKLIGGVLGGVLSGIGGGLDGLADGLISFSEKMGTVGDNMSKIDSNIANNVKTLAEALLILGGAEFVDAITDLLEWIPGVSSDDMNFGALGEGVAAFAESVKDLSPDSVSKASICAQIAASLGDIQGVLGTKGGLAGMIFGNKQTIADFGASLVEFAGGLVAFVQALEQLTADHIIKAQMAAQACQPMLELTSQLSESGGLIQGLMGEKDLGDFGAKLAAFANGLVNFVALIDAIDKKWPTYPETIQKCADATQPMIDLANGLENMGGVLADVIGDNTLDKFGDTLVPFARDFKRFIKLASETVEKYPNMVGNINQIVLATQKLIDLSKNLDNMGGFLADWAGDNTLDKFGETLGPFGEGIGEFCDNIMDSDIELISAMADQVTVLVDVCKQAMGVDPESFNNLIYAVAGMAKVFELGGDSGVDTNTFLQYGTNMVTGLMTGVENAFVTTFGPYLRAFVAKIVDIFYKGMSVEVFLIYGKNIVQGINDGIRAVESTISTKIGAMINSIKSKLGIEMAPSKFEIYGQNIVTGLVKGIDDHADEAISAAKRLAEEVNRITADTFQEKSPSRVAYKYGKNYDIGLANGLTDYAAVAVDSASEMSDEIVAGANSIIGAIRQSMDENIDTEPVIRPVLDTSDITKKASTIGKLFDSSDLSLAYSASSTMKNVAANKADSVYSKIEGSDEVVAGNQINFTQNNYSPKALSRMEIYRQTKNQLNMMKGVVKSYA